VPFSLFQKRTFVRIMPLASEGQAREQKNFWFGAKMSKRPNIEISRQVKPTIWGPRLLAGATLLFLSAGCASTEAIGFPGLGAPKVATQASDAPDAFRDAPPAPAGQSAAWWARFSDPVLDSLVREALSESLSVQAANQRLIEARSTGRATIAGFAPRITASVSADTDYAVDGPPLVNVNGGTEDRQTNRVEAARASWEVPLFGRGLSAFSGTRAGVRGAQADIEAAKVAVIGDIAAGYVDLRNAQLSVAYLREDLERAERLANIAQARLQVGLVSASEASLAVSQAAQVRERLPDAILRERATLDRLAILRGVMPGSLDQRLAPVSDFNFKSDAPTVDSVPANFVRRRLDVSRAEQNAILAAAQVGVSRADMYPSVSITGTITKLASIAGGGLGADLTRGNVSPAISIPLFDLGQRRAALRTSNARFQQALLQYRATTLSAVAEGQAALTSYEQSRNRADAALRAEQAAQTRQRASASAYDAGLVSFKERLEADRDLASARQNRLSSQAQFSDAAIGLYRTFAGAPGI
jgi:NodT family efflux transporter outer membrane factor (OMF) lipoprotein